MNFDYNEEQRLLAESVRRFVAQDYGFETRRRIVASDEGFSRDVWKTMAELGLLGIPLPVEHGGFGGGAVDMMSVMEAIGDALVVEPYLPTVGLGAQFVKRGGSSDQQARILPAVVEGRLTLAFAHTEAQSRYDLADVQTVAHRSGDGYAIDGEKRAVLHGAGAEELIVSARVSGGHRERDGLCLFLIERDRAGLALKPRRALDGVRIADVRFEGVQVPAGALVGPERGAFPLIEEVVDFATALVCAEAIGAMKSACDTTLEYLKTRKQFGVPIGSFQALQHRMVEMVISLEQARSLASLACSRVDTEKDPAARRRIVSAAKFRIAEACRHVSQESVQLHGGMGMSDELKVSHTFRRLTMLAQQFGDADHHLERFSSHPGCP